MPLYEFTCDKCGKTTETLAHIGSEPPICCEAFMRRLYSGEGITKIKYPLWVDRMEDIHKAQEQKGERFRMVHPKEIV